MLFNHFFMDIYGIAGISLAHSFSPSFFTQYFEEHNIAASYQKFELKTISAFNQLIKEVPGLKGLNITIPYKQVVIPYLNEIDETALHIGAVNCINIKNGLLKGYNTDYLGFKNSLIPLLQTHHSKALILGSGGAAQAIVYTLKSLDISFKIVSRKKEAGFLSYENVDREMLHQYRLIINTTPLGMFPDTNSAPAIPYEYLTPQHLLYDVIYNPEETVFLKKGKEQGAVIKNGFEMLVIQAEESWKIWNQPTV